MDGEEACFQQSATPNPKGAAGVIYGFTLQRRKMEFGVVSHMGRDSFKADN